MDCLHSMAPSDEEFLRYVLDGEPLVGKAKEHLRGCSICQRRLARYEHAEAYLIAKLYRSQCPSAMQLNLYCASMLAADEAERVARHVGYCPLCFDEVKETQKMLAEFEPLPAYLLDSPFANDVDMESS